MQIKTMAQGNKERAFMISAIAINALVSVFLIASLVYLFTQVAYQRDELKNLRDQLQNSKDVNWQNKAGRNTMPRQRAKYGEGDSDDENPSYRKSTAPLCCGIKGRKGRAGPKGDPGEKGERGRDGGYGPVGLPGRDGKPGEKGEKGTSGLPGMKGEAGICGSNVISKSNNSALAHLVGNTNRKKINNLEANAVSSWDEKHVEGKIKYKNGYLVVDLAGYYYIYSQMVYCDSKKQLVGHSMKISGKKVLEAIYEAKSHRHNYETKYIGGIFKLNKGDKISVSPYVTNMDYCFNSDDAFFGAYLVRY